MATSPEPPEIEDPDATAVAPPVPVADPPKTFKLAPVPDPELPT